MINSTPGATTRRKPRKFDKNAKVIATTLAVSALVGGWNILGHMEEAKAEAKVQGNEPALDIPAATITPIKLPTPTPMVAAVAGPESFAVAPIPTLQPMSALLAGGTQGVGQASAGVGIQLPSLQALAPLPTMEPLPAMPAMPAPPAASSGGGGNGGGGGGTTSGGS